MPTIFSAKSPLQLVTAVTIVVICLNTFLPLNYTSVEAEATAYPYGVSVRLKITLEKTAYKSGERVNVTWILTNIGEENITLYHSADRLPDFIVYDANFLHVSQYTRVWAIPAVYYPFTPLPPSHNWTITEYWDQTYDGSGKVIPALWHKEVPSGIYYVTGFFSSATYQIKLQTPAIRITIGG